MLQGYPRNISACYDYALTWAGTFQSPSGISKVLVLPDKKKDIFFSIGIYFLIWG